MKNFKPLHSAESNPMPYLQRELTDQFQHCLSILCLPKSHVTLKLEIVHRLKLKENSQSVIQYVYNTDRYLRKEQFVGPWHKDKYKEFLMKIKHSREIRYHWNMLMDSIGMGKNVNDHTALLGQVIKAFSRSRCMSYLKQKGFGYNTKECDAI